ncbi:MAG: hypothetical protein U0359_05265 [Byssovorax sp.]
MPTFSSRPLRSTGLSLGALLALTGLSQSAAAGPDLGYYGGPVISNVEVVQVSWTDQVSATFAQKLTGFYQTLLASDALDWLSEYDTIGKVGLFDGLPGTEQHIGRGHFASAHVITPSVTEAMIDDATLAAELVAQIKSGALPPPTLDKGGFTNTLYMIDLPAGVSMPGACSVFLAYHGTTLLDNTPIPYGVHPDCGESFGISTVAHSHELIEAITDPDTGLLLSGAPARPMAWRTPFINIAMPAEEIADLCDHMSYKLDRLSVTKAWSNFAGKCVGRIPICDGSNTPPDCRPCNTFDSGVGCAGDKALCATEGALAGQCVACTAVDATACTAETPHCDASANVCVGCLAAEDCADPRAAVCDMMSKSCRGCQASEECKEGVCDKEAGVCVACIADTDCKDGQVCEANACKDAPPPPTPPAASSGCATRPERDGDRGLGVLLLLGAAAILRRRPATGGSHLGRRMGAPRRARGEV